MNTKKIIFPVLAAFSLLVVGCNNSNPGSTSTSAPSSSVTQPSSSSSEEVATTYTVTFNSKGGSAVKKQTVKEGETAKKPANPTKGGYKFLDWYTEDTYTTVYDFSTPVTADITLFAKWELSVDSVLVSSLGYYSTDADTEISVFANDPTFRVHTIDGWTAGTFNMSWRTIIAVDAEGRVCFGVWCPANGYGNPSEYTYVSHEYYGPNGVGYTNNPAFVLGAGYPANPADYEIVIPEGGFIITCHSLGSNDVAGLVTGTDYVLFDESGTIGEEQAKAFNKTHGEWSTRTLKLNTADACIDAYDLATHVTISGDYSGAFTGDAATATYTKTFKAFAGKKVSLHHFDGLLSLPINASNHTVTGDFGDGAAVNVDPENNNVFVINKTGNYTFKFEAATGVLTITREEVSEFTISFVDIIGKAPASLPVVKNGTYTLPTPTEIPAGYTFSGWVDGTRNTVASTGTYTLETDLTLYASYQKGDSKVAYSGKLGGLAKDYDATLTYWSEGTEIHNNGQWNTNGWRLYVVVDAEGRICYAVFNPVAGYGGPTGGTFMCHDYYKSTGAGYEANPAIEILDGYGPWEPGGTAHNKFIIKVPTGGFGMSAYAPDHTRLMSMISNGVYSNVDDSTIDQYIAEINSDQIDVNNILSYDAAANEVYFSLF